MMTVRLNYILFCKIVVFVLMDFFEGPSFQTLLGPGVEFLRTGSVMNFAKALVREQGGISGGKVLTHRYIHLFINEEADKKTSHIYVNL